MSRIDERLKGYVFYVLSFKSFISCCCVARLNTGLGASPPPALRIFSGNVVQLAVATAHIQD